MDSYVEKKRERRIRDYYRMVFRAYRVTKTWWPCPNYSQTNGPLTWDEVHRYRWRDAKRNANNLKRCSCSLGCGNSRRHWGVKSRQEYRKSLDEIEQLIDLGLLDDSPGKRDVRRLS